MSIKSTVKALVLKEHRNKVFSVELPEYRVTENAVFSPANWGEIEAEEFAFFLREQKGISRIELERYAMMWMELVRDNSPLRAVINNRVIGVSEPD